MADIATVADILERSHHRRIVDFLLAIKLPPPRHTGRMHVADQRRALFPDPPDQIPVHHLHVVNVEQQLHQR